MRKPEFASHDGQFDTIECYADENNTAVVRNDGRGNTYVYMSESAIRSFCEHLLHLTNSTVSEQSLLYMQWCQWVTLFPMI